MFARALVFAAAFSGLLSACTTTAETIEAPSEEAPDQLGVTFRIVALNTCAEDSARVQAIRPRGEDLVLLRIGGALQENGSESTLDLLLRSPGACGSVDRCGHMLVRVDPSSKDAEALRFLASTNTFEVPLATLETPLGHHTVEVLIQGDDGLQAIGADGQPLAKTIEIDVVAPDDSSCTPQP